MQPRLKRWTIPESKTLESINDLLRESICRHYQDLERCVRRYIRDNRTTRLDFEVDVGELKIAECDGSVFFRVERANKYQANLTREVRFRQKLPCGWRAPLPD